MPAHTTAALAKSSAGVSTPIHEGGTDTQPEPLPACFLYLYAYYGGLSGGPLGPPLPSDGSVNPFSPPPFRYDLEFIINLIDERETAAKKRGPYKNEIIR